MLMEYIYPSILDNIDGLTITSISDEEENYESDCREKDEDEDYYFEGSLFESYHQHEEKEYTYLPKDECKYLTGDERVDTCILGDDDSPPMVFCLSCERKRLDECECLDLDGNDYVPEEKEVHENRSFMFCDVCNKEGHFIRDCRVHFWSCEKVNLAKKSRQKERKSNEKLLCNHMEKVDWKTIGRVNGLSKEKETLQTPKKFIKQKTQQLNVAEKKGKNEMNKWKRKRRRLAKKYG
ncbi:13849_t:CDS:1 [Acaulospora colombiana]|uniref:13849_t:CDS:1 n=1 Tax=Acaulospora colombiana TaxID=27376 RepID=A0ACA9KTQ5_9GLOM|nr:13849_t:CDS:1 [Acaulospora colombiana]